MIIAIDLDGTICEEKRTFEKGFAKPLSCPSFSQNFKVNNSFGQLITLIPANEDITTIDIVNTLHLMGHTIIIFTARSWAELPMTLKWLEEYEVKYHTIVCGKPVYDVLIDDRSKTNLLDFIKELGEEE